jgi:hypothetical protein
MKTMQKSDKTSEETSKPDPKRRDGAHANDPNREDTMNGAHQGSTGQRDKHDR